MAEPSRMPYVGRSMLRREDRRLLLGEGQYVGDLQLPPLVHAAFVRSPMAHARIRSVDLARAAAAPGVAIRIERDRVSAIVAHNSRPPSLAPQQMADSGAPPYPQPAASFARGRQGAPCRRGF